MSALGSCCYLFCMTNAVLGAAFFLVLYFYSSSGEEIFHNGRARGMTYQKETTSSLLYTFIMFVITSVLIWTCNYFASSKPVAKQPRNGGQPLSSQNEL